MYKLDIESIDFPKALPNSIEFSKAKLAWAAITTGKPNKAAAKRHAGYSFHEVNYRWNMFLSVLDLSCSDHFIRSSVLFDDMDPTEKGGTNYFLGMAFSKLLAQELLDVPWLAHYSWYRKAGSIRWSPSRSTADLVGEQVSSGRHLIIEAKGRNGSSVKGALAKAVAQAKQNYIVDGQPCVQHIGSVLYRESTSRRLKIVWQDPPPRRDAPTLKLEADRQFWEEYYSTPWDLWNLQEESPEEFFRRMGFRMKFAEPLRKFLEVRSADDNVRIPRLNDLREWSRSRSEQKSQHLSEIWNGDGIAILDVKD